MFLSPLSLQDLTRLRDPSERVPLSERLVYRDALQWIEEGRLEQAEMINSPGGLLRVRMDWRDPAANENFTVDIREATARGTLLLSCSLCRSAGRAVEGCEHQWASFILLWQSVTQDKDLLSRGPLAALTESLRRHLLQIEAEESRGTPAEFADVVLDSISLYVDEPALLKGPSLGSLLTEDLSRYQGLILTKEQERLSPRLWNLPEIFRRKLSAFSEHAAHETNRQNRLADIVRYNFSNGLQISAKELLRHPLHRKVPVELLPEAKSQKPLFAAWPLVQQTGPVFVSQATRELEEIIQSLLARLTSPADRHGLDLYLQSKGRPGAALKIQFVEFDPTRELDWRVDFTERDQLETEFKLVSTRKKPMAFFESFAVEPESGALVVHPWLHELSLLQEKLANLGEHLMLPEGKMPTIHVASEFETKMILKHLRTRSLPVKISGESRTLPASESLTEIHLHEDGSFHVQHDARVPEQKNLVRRGWTTKSMLLLEALSQGLPALLNAEARDIAARTGSKRDWDLKLIKHLGILQLIAFEALSLHFDGALSDGAPVEKDSLLLALQGKIRALLTAAGGTFVREIPLADLCSKSVLACLDDFAKFVFKSIDASEAFYSEQGEIVLEGIVEREFRLIHLLLKKTALATGGECFRRSRTSFLSRIADGDPERVLPASTLFHLPSMSGKEAAGLHEALEDLQALIPHGFRLHFKGQQLQELDESEFLVDFTLQSGTEEKLFNWFELNPRFFLRGEEVDPDRLLSLGGGGVIEYEGKLYLVPRQQMPKLKRLENFWRKLQKGKLETVKKNNGDKIYQLPRHQTLELLALRASGVGIRGDAEWKKLCDFYDTLGTQTRPLNLPASVTADLKPYQALGVQWLQDLFRLRLGALLADDMGLGKTLQTLAFLDGLRASDELGHALIVVPSSLVFNWQHEAEKFTPELPMVVFSNRDRESVARRLESKQQTVVIVTYGLLMEHEELLSQYKWKVLVFDEAQNLKNITTKRTGSARALTAQFKIALTGTPMENHYGEFYSLVDLLVPGSLGPIEDFRRRFVNTELVSREEIADLKHKIKPLLLRRTKKEILDQLPQKQETKVAIAFEEKQKEIYRDIALSYNRRVQETMATQGEASVQLQMLTALLRLRQACSDPAALPNVRYDKVPPKLETLMDSLREIVESGESALVFTQFLQTLDHTASLLKKAGIPVFVLHGGVPARQRQKILSDFHSLEGGAVLVMTLKTGGVGLNLTKASYVFHLEPWWNPSVENQATDRAHRMGQNKAVQVFRYIMHESLEEKIELLKDRKERKFQTLFSTTENDVEIGTGGNALSKKDFDLLLGLD